jgi:alcohol dehydrogenase class IV
VDKAAQARQLLQKFKGNTYKYGPGALGTVGPIAAGAGTRAVLIADSFPGSDRYISNVRDSLRESGVELVTVAQGARPNCPREDLHRITDVLRDANPDVYVSFGGGSTIDAGKAAEVLRTLGGQIDEYFGTGLVTARKQALGVTLTPHIAIQTAASSGAHLTKYSNITDLATGQKKLIVDDAIVPPHPVFDFSVTYDSPSALTADGALDGVAHSLEVLYGSVGKPNYAEIREIAATSIELVVANLPKVLENPDDTGARDMLCLATDMGAYAIMLGGTNGGHLTSFSLVDILSHGRACALMNPYYTVFFAPAIEDALRLVGSIYREYGYSNADFAGLTGRPLGVAVAESMFGFQKAIGFPVRLNEVSGFTDGHIDRALEAAKSEQLKMKLQNMPVPLTAEMIDEYMGPVLRAARVGDLEMIRNVP